MPRESLDPLGDSGGGLEAPLSQLLDCIRNNSDNGNVCFEPGSAVARGETRFVDSQNSSRYLSIESAASVTFDAVNQNSIIWQVQGSNAMAIESAQILSYHSFLPSSNDTLDLGSDTNHWLNTYTNSLRNIADGGVLEFRAGSGTTRGIYRFEDSQLVGPDLDLFYDSTLNAWEFFTTDNMIARVGQGNSFIVGERSSGGLDLELIRISRSSTVLRFDAGSAVAGGVQMYNGGGFGLFLLGRNGSEYVGYDPANKAWIPSANLFYSLGKSNARWQFIHGINLLNQSGGTTNGTINITAGSNTSRGWASVTDPEGEWPAVRLNGAVINTTTTNSLQEYRSTEPASVQIDATSLTTTTLANAGTNHKIMPKEVMIKALSGTFGSDVSVNLGTTGNLTKYLSNQPLFGLTPAVGDVATIPIADRSDVDDLILTISTAASGTNPVLRAYSTILRTENE